MKLSELKSVLFSDATLNPRFILPNGWELPEDSQLKEVAHVQKAAVECDGTGRLTETCTLELWIDPGAANPRNKRTFLQILEQADSVLPPRDLNLQITYDGANFWISSFEVSGAYIDLFLAKHADCPSEAEYAFTEALGQCTVRGSATACA